MKRREFITLLGGAAAAWPLTVRAQRSRPVRIGILSTAGTPTNLLFETFRQELRRLGYVEGSGIVIEFRSARGDFPRIPSLAAELVGLPVDVLLTDGGPAAFAAKQATSTIPIVMATIGDPVAQGIVKNLARPGGNITGFSLVSVDLSSKRIELLKELFPALHRAGVLWNPLNSALQFAATEAAARALGVVIVSGEAQMDGACALAARPRLRWDIQNSSPLCRRNIAPPPPKPRGGPRALAGERSEAIRLAVRDHHTRSLGAESPAQREQWCCWIGRRHIISGSAETAAIPALSAIDQRPQASLLTSWH